MNQLEAGESVRGTDLAHHWNVTEKTAKRDIADLKKQGIIEFVGSPKTGSYRLKEEGDVTRAGRN
jgi:predicted DNA-binding transcriptional regulator YafY